MTTESFDKTYKIDWIPCRDIGVVWNNAQRPFDERHAKSIAARFVPDQFDPIKVTRANGHGYHVVEGQHRKAALEMLFGAEERCPCIVLPDADVAKAAGLFVGVNTGRKTPHPVDLFKVKVTAGEETETAVQHIVQRCGYRVHNAKTEKNIQAVASLVGVYRRHGARVLMFTLRTIRATWGEDRNAVSAPIIRGYGEFIAEFDGKIDLDRLIERVQKKFTPGRFVATSKSARELNGGDMAGAVKQVLITNYNHGLRTGLLSSK